jgi:hypothetical protein
MVLLGERDEDVLDAVVEAERLHRPHLRADDLSVPGRRYVEVEVLPAADRAERHAALPVDERRANGAVNVHGFLQSRFNIHVFPPSANARLMCRNVREGLTGMPVICE